MKPAPYSTIPLPDGIVIGGEWPNTIVSWPGGKLRGATKPEYDLFQALEAAHKEIERLVVAVDEVKSAKYDLFQALETTRQQIERLLLIVDEN